MDIVNRKNLLLYSSLLLNLFIVSFLVGKRYYYYRSGLPENRTDIAAEKQYKRNFNKYAVDLFKAIPHDTSDIVFLGTSLTRGFPLQELFNDCRLKNRGVIGNTTADIINRLSEVTDGHPQKIFLEVGTNDLSQYSINYTFNQLIRIISTIKEKTAHSKIYVQSVLPFGKSLTPKIEAYNKKVEQYCKSQSIPFINLYPYYLGNNSMKKELTTDGIHLTAAGYLIWKKEVSKYL
jgi:lysophospholipase L1-like esterase